MPFIRNGRPEPGPDPSEGPQRPSSVSHKTRRTLSLSNRQLDRENSQGSDTTAAPTDFMQSVPVGVQDRQGISATLARPLRSLAYYQ